MRILTTALVIAVAILGLDQWSKQVVARWVSEAGGAIEVSSYLNLILVGNRGVSFGMFQGVEQAQWLFSLLALAIVVGLCWWLRHIDRRMVAVAVGLIIGGALGNVIDRLRFGYVIDFLDFHLYGYHWHTFNIADTAICIGAALLILDNICEVMQQKRNPTPSSS